MKEAVKKEARRLGFELVGVTTPEPPPHCDVYERWLAAGRHAGMGYLEIDKARCQRSDPRLLLPECSSILVLAMRYWAPDKLSAMNSEEIIIGEVSEEDRGEEHKDQVPRGKVAAYAWGEDYHEVFKDRLKRLVEFIRSEAGHEIPNRWYSDTGAILERDLAQRAGLGWIGKNTCLINPQKGSYFLLAEILLGLDLEPDPPFVHDRCGSCSRCIETCPTGCILPDRTIDSQRCISYLTIELKDEIPRELRPLTGDWVFGCDVCQQVCPWNQRFAEVQGDPTFEPRQEVVFPKLLDEINLNQDAFSRKFNKSPVKRAKRRGYLRNVAIALGNNPNPKTVTYLAKVLIEEPDALVRSHVAWALGRRGGKQGKEILEKALQMEKDDLVMEEILQALMEF